MLNKALATGIPSSVSSESKTRSRDILDFIILVAY